MQPVDDVREEDYEVDTKEAFQVVIQELKSSLDRAREQGERAFKDRHYAEAQIKAQAAEQIEKDFQALTLAHEHWKKHWSDIALKEREPLRVPKVRVGRSPKGARTPEKAFRLPLLQALVEMNGRGNVRYVLDQVGKLMEGNLKLIDFEVIESAHEIRWRNTAKWERSRMVKEGLLRSDSPIGTWEITDEGRRVLKESRYKQ